MTKITASYQGELRIASTHVKSNTHIETDAPTDNNGKGTRFSPTDLLATAYMNCMITIIGIYCDKNEITFNGCQGEVEKIMADSPRRIGQLNVTLDLSSNNWNEKEKRRIENTAKNCPVAQSISPEIKIEIDFKY